MNAAGFRGEKRIDVNPRKKEGVNCGAAIGVLNMHIAGRGHFEHQYKAVHGRQITDLVRLFRGVSGRALGKHLIKLIVDHFSMVSPIIAFA